MKDQQLYLDGILMDLGENTDIILDIKSNLFRDITKMTANNTYTIQLPKTAHNIAVLEFSGKPSTNTKYPFIFHTARFFRNGLEIIHNGRASVLSIEDNIEISVYWGLFPALTALQSSDLKLNELPCTKYLRFNKKNYADKYDDAIKEGVFYADYNPAQVDESTDDWAGYDITQGANREATYEFIDGKIKTGTETGAHISGEVLEDEAYKCLIIPFKAGEVASASSVIGSGDYRTWAVADEKMNIVSLSDDATDEYLPTDIDLQAPANAAYLVINTIKEYSASTTLKVNSKTESKARGVISTQASGGGSFGGNGSTDSGDTGSSSTGGGSFDGGTNGGGAFHKTQVGPIQPTASCNYILGLISKKTNVSFAWSEAAQEVVDGLAIPLVTRKADKNSLDGGIAATFYDTTSIGMLGFKLTKAAAYIFEQTSTGVKHSQLTAKAECKMIFDVQMIWSWNASGTSPTMWITSDYNGSTQKIGVYRYPACYIEVKVVSLHNSSQEESEYTKTYIAGLDPETDEGKTNYITDYSTSLVNGRFIHLAAGRGEIDLAAGDIITFEMKNPADKNLRDIKCYNGILTADVKPSDEVPYGGNFPIGINLPDIKVVDFIKAISVITGTFPCQQASDGVLKFSDIQALMSSRNDAADWTKKLIPSYGANLPKQTDFTVEDYCQHNIYKWKEDSTIYNKHDADMVIENETLEFTQDTYTLPFAASDGNRIPLYEWEETEGGTFGSSGKTSRSRTATKYKGCKDRIVNLSKTETGKVSLTFNIDLQEVFDTKLAKLRKSIGNARQITERFRLTDLEILNFDETKPVYLAQYGCYFAVIEIKTTDNGYCEVTMIEI